MRFSFLSFLLYRRSGQKGKLGNKLRRREKLGRSVDYSSSQRFRVRSHVLVPFFFFRQIIFPCSFLVLCVVSASNHKNDSIFKRSEFSLKKLFREERREKKKEKTKPEGWVLVLGRNKDRFLLGHPLQDCSCWT